MSKAVRICLERAAELRDELLAEQYEGLLQSFLGSDTVRQTLDTAATEDRAAVAQVVASSAAQRARELKGMTRERQIVLLMAAVRHCLEAASILEGFQRHLEGCPPDLSVIEAAHLAHDWLYRDERADWPESAGWDLSFFR